MVMACNALIGQDIHFSQFHEQNSLINPALVGSNRLLRAGIVYRNQWSSVSNPFTTYGFSIDSKLKASNWDLVEKTRTMIFKQSFNKLAAGLSVYKDKAGTSNLENLNVNLSIAMRFPINIKNSISFGLQGSFVQKSVNRSKLLYPDQFNGAYYDANMLSQDAQNSATLIYPDFGSGLVYTYDKNERVAAIANQIKFQLGYAVYHLTQPNKHFVASTSNEKLYMKQVVYADLLYDIKNSNIGLAPSVLIQLQGPSKEILAGITVKRYFKDASKYTGIVKRTSFNMGVFYRNKDAVIPSFSLDLDRISVGYSYDINISNLANASKLKGGSEITLKFKSTNPYLYQRKSRSKKKK